MYMLSISLSVSIYLDLREVCLAMFILVEQLAEQHTFTLKKKIG